MDNKFYSRVRGVQILLSVLKANNIKKVIASPGTADMTIVGSMQCDTFFEMYSCVDERSAAYMACGLAAESGEPVVIVCTEATASRNYMPGLTEAFYRKLPILAVTGSHSESSIGNLVPQVIDRRSLPNDIALMSVRIPKITDRETEAAANLNINRAVSELRHRGGGPVHIDITASYDFDFSVKELPPTRIIHRFTVKDALPVIPQVQKKVIFIGSHPKFSKQETSAIERFCERNNAVVMGDHTSNYHGRFYVNYSLVASQTKYVSPNSVADILIHIGEVSGEYFHLSSKQTWRVSPDGELRDTFHTLTDVFEMTEKDFFDSYSQSEPIENTLMQVYQDECKKIKSLIPDLPFSNVWTASQLAPRLPERSVIHFGILNSLRAWNFFDINTPSMCSCNVGGFGIDGGVSTLLGASLAHPEQLHFGVFGDLAFFYDMNAIGSRHIGANLRILLVNNGKGSEFRLFWQPAHQFGDEADRYISAACHFGDKSPKLVRHFAEDLGFRYLTASNKEEFSACMEEFIAPKMGSNPILFEIFTTNEQENEAVEKLRTLLSSPQGIVNEVKQKIKGKLGNDTIDGIKMILGKK